MKAAKLGVMLLVGAAGCGHIRFDPQDADATVPAPDGATMDGSAPDGSAPDGSMMDGSAPDGSTMDGSAPDGSAMDAGGGDGGCTPGPWSAPTELTELPTTGDLWGPNPTDGDLTLYGAQTLSGDQDMWVAMRPSRAAPFGTLTFLTEINSTSIEANPFLSADGRSLYFASDRAGGTGNRDLWVARRAATTGPFDPASPITSVNSVDTDGSPGLTADELAIFFNSSRTGSTGASSLWTATRASTLEAFGAPAEMTALSSPQTELSPGITPDGLTLFFVSDRAGTLGNLDLWLSQRVSRAASFGAPVHLDTLSSSGIEDDPQPTADGMTLYFSSNRSGAFRIYRATRACL
jgi:hypothetical protein